MSDQQEAAESFVSRVSKILREACGHIDEWSAHDHALQDLALKADAEIDRLTAQLAKSCDDSRFGDADVGCPRAIKADAEIDRLRAERQWQPIETAPKDGTIVDLLFRGNIRIADCIWYQDEWWTTEQRDPVACVSHGFSKPTHWMPRPEPPND